MLELGVLALAAGLAGAGFLLWQVRQRHGERWLPSYVRDAARRRDPSPGEEVHLLLCVADHYEPKFANPGPDVALSRVLKWVNDYPARFGGFADSDGRPPRHTFFYPAEEYEPEYLEALAGLCRRGHGEVEIHLHHDGDTTENLRATLAAFRDLLAGRHGLLARHAATGEVAYGFIHGNWALCNARPDGRLCGVNEELEVLRQTGCYADFTLPSAPDVTQTPTLNRIYYARNVPGRPRSHDHGVPAGAGPAPADGLLLIQGPLVLDWRRRKWGLVPRVENGCLQHTQPPDLGRLPLWLRARVQVPARPDWFFVKLHAHGAVEDSHEALLGEPMARFHEALAGEARRNPRFHYHYVTAREMYNLVKAAESGWSGDVAGALDYELLAGPACRPAPRPGEVPAGR